MQARLAVLKTPPKSSVSSPLPLYKNRALLTHPESTLLQVLIPLHFNSPTINTYKKTGGGTPPCTPKVLQLVTSDSRPILRCHTCPLATHQSLALSEAEGSLATIAFRITSPLWKSPHQYHSMRLTHPLFSYSYALFCTGEKLILNLFSTFRTLCAKHPGGIWPQCHSCLFSLLHPYLVASLPHLFLSLCDSHKPIRAAVVKQKLAAPLHHALDKHHARNLPDLFPILFRRKHRLICPRNQFSRIGAVKDRHARAIHQLVVRPVVHQHDSRRRQNGRRPRLDHPRIKFSRPSRKHGSLRRLCPVNQIVRIRKPHLVCLVRGGPEPVHPILPADFFRHNGARLGPPHVPVALVRRQYHALALPVNQVLRRGKAKLRIFFVVSGVRQVVRVAEFLQPWVLDAAVFFVVRFGRKDRLGAPRKMNSIHTLRIPKPRSSSGVLRAIQHDDFYRLRQLFRRRRERTGHGHNDHRGIESSGGFPARALRRKNRSVRCAPPRTERQASGASHGSCSYSTSEKQKSNPALCETHDRSFGVREPCSRFSFAAVLQRNPRGAHSIKECQRSGLSRSLSEGILLRRLNRFRPLEFRRTHNSFAFFHHDQLVGFYVFQRIDRAARLANFEQLDFFRLSDAEVHAQIILRNVAPAA